VKAARQNPANVQVTPGQEELWRELAATKFGGRIELGDDPHRVEVAPRR
jgi:ribonuclease Z